MFIDQNRPRVSSLRISSAVGTMKVNNRESKKKQIGKKVGFWIIKTGPIYSQIWLKTPDISVCLKQYVLSVEIEY